ncbi:hypothetical protein BCR44DRAFT_290183 [Catenaria anguillulae PL171]|uniref:Uncharacterized protein n=1 Tax=Catenaria anguillulae PL171 TaxID=765915 RepID=A0A1Y2H4H1_9FUNG|nr:hypothetical protein BCR44DRAFT_290183 [Catenaria anguillulae PL171]
MPLPHCSLHVKHLHSILILGQYFKYLCIVPLIVKRCSDCLPQSDQQKLNILSKNCPIQLTRRVLLLTLRVLLLTLRVLLLTRQVLLLTCRVLCPKSCPPSPNSYPPNAICYPPKNISYPPKTINRTWTWVLYLTQAGTQRDTWCLPRGGSD